MVPERIKGNCVAMACCFGSMGETDNCDHFNIARFLKVQMHISGAVNPVPFTRLKIQIQEYQGEIHVNVPCLIRRFTSCLLRGICLVIYFSAADN